MSGQYQCSNGDATRSKLGAMYRFGPGSMIGKHTFSHWYIGRKLNTTNRLSLYRRRMVYQSGDLTLGDAEEMVEDVSDMDITVLRMLLYSGYPINYEYDTLEQFNFIRGSGAYGAVPRRGFALRIVLTLTSPDKVGIAVNNAASAATYRIPINVTIRARMPGVVRR